jgi:arginine N-succinyltransferase
MTFVVRAARLDDLAAVYQIAKSTGGGFTNLPPDRPALKARLARAAAAFGRDDDALGDDLFLFVLEDTATRKVRGTCLIFSRIGSTWPFYSYRVATMSNYSKELDRTLRYEMLTLSTDLDGASEVGGLFLHPGERSAGVGALLARSRYLFIAMHRARFADRTIAELRGAHDETGGSAFWDGLAGRFFGMGFREADEFNAVQGNQFIADLMPKHPIYTALLPESARAVIGQPHNSGRAAMRMLEKEGFAYESYVDIFDGGPTMAAATDRIETVRNAKAGTVVAIGEIEDGTESLVAHGGLSSFRAICGVIAAQEQGVKLSEAAAKALNCALGDTVTHVPR